MIIFNEDEVDVLKEIVNISYGMATALITNSAGTHVRLSVPELIVASVNQIQDLMDKIPVSMNDCIVTNQKFKGAYMGESLLLVDEKSALDFASLMLDEPAEELEEDDIESCALELSNILTSVSIGKLAELLGSHISFSSPVLVESKLDDLIVTYQNNSFDQFFTIKTWISGSEKNIVGYLVIFINQDSFQYLKSAIDRFMEEHV